MLSIFLLNCPAERKEPVGTFSPPEISSEAVNINTASPEELEKLPHVGAKTAARIVEHRKKFGKFRRPEHLLLVEGISDKRFRNMRKMVKVD